MTGFFTIFAAVLAAGITERIIVEVIVYIQLRKRGSKVGDGVDEMNRLYDEMVKAYGDESDPLA